MKRREFLGGATVAGFSGITGCSILGPEMEFQNFIVPDPRAVSVNQDGNEYNGTIDNRGDEGSVRVELWHFKDSDVPSPKRPSIFLPAKPSQNRDFALARNSFFRSDERREVALLNDGAPNDWDEFGIIPWPSSYGAVFKNTGGSGRVKATFKYIDSTNLDVQTPQEKVESVGSDQTLEVIFQVIVPPGVEYEIIAEPA
jgi:hypothetical protein